MLLRAARGAARGSLSAAKPRALVSVAPTEAFPAPFFAMLQAKDAELKAERAAKDAERAAAAVELKAERAAAAVERAAKDAERAAKDAERAAAAVELKAERAAKDAERAAAAVELKDLRAAAAVELKDLRATMGARDAAFSELRLISQRDAAALAAALHLADTARNVMGVRASLEVCIGDLWAFYGAGNKTRGSTDRLRVLAKGLCPPLVEYVQEAAAANGIDPRKALDELPQLYHKLSAPMHRPGFEDDVETPIDAILNGDPTTLLLVSCLFKMTRRELRLYRMDAGERVSVRLKLKEPPVPMPT
jgi:hypothetical protein